MAKKMVPEDYLRLTPGDLRRVVRAQETLGSILNDESPTRVLQLLQDVEATCRRIAQDAFWRAF